MNLVPAFLLEGCLATLIKNAVVSGDINMPIELSPLLQATRLYADLFKNEHLNNYEVKEDIFMARIHYFAEKGLL